MNKEEFNVAISNLEVKYQFVRNEISTTKSVLNHVVGLNSINFDPLIKAITDSVLEGAYLVQQLNRIKEERIKEER